MLERIRLGLAIAMAGADQVLKAADLRRTLYVHRKLQPASADALIAWAKKAGFPSTIPAEDMHVTIAFSRNPVNWIDMGSAYSETVEVPPGGPRMLAKFGEGDIVLIFSNDDLEWRHRSMLERGASWDHPDYHPHVTISYDPDFEIEGVEAYQGKLVFGPEHFAEVDGD